MGTLLERCEGALGRRLAGAAVVLTVIGAAALLGGLMLGFGSAALGVLAASWLFFAGIAAGGVAFSAAVRCSRGRWADGALPAVEATAGFFPTALVLLGVLVLAAPAWIPGGDGVGWAGWASKAVRDLAATAVLFALGARYLRRARATKPAPSVSAVAYLLAYVAVLSLWAIDLVMDLHEWAPSTVIPPFYFIGAFLGAIALGAFVVAVRRAVPSGAETRHDLGMLLFAMVIFWGYLLWAAYLPVWYGNLPDETGQLLARWVGGWKFLTVAVLVAVLGFPFFFLLPERSKRGQTSLAVVSASILAGLFGERVLLVLPSLPVHADAPSVLLGTSVALGVLGAFVLTVGAGLGTRTGRGGAESHGAGRVDAPP